MCHIQTSDFTSVHSVHLRLHGLSCVQLVIWNEIFQCLQSVFFKLEPALKWLKHTKHTLMLTLTLSFCKR